MYMPICTHMCKPMRVWRERPTFERRDAMKSTKVDIHMWNHNIILENGLFFPVPRCLPRPEGNIPLFSNTACSRCHSKSSVKVTSFLFALDLVDVIAHQKGVWLMAFIPIFYNQRSHWGLGCDADTHAWGCACRRAREGWEVSVADGGGREGGTGGLRHQHRAPFPETPGLLLSFSLRPYTHVFSLIDWFC